MSTTVDDLICLEDRAVAVAYQAVETSLAVWGEPEEGAMRMLLEQSPAVIERAELYGAAEESNALSIEDYEAQRRRACRRPARLGGVYPRPGGGSATRLSAAGARRSPPPARTSTPNAN